MEKYGTIQKWVKAIISDDLEIVVKDLKELENWHLDVESNRQLFKALLCLAHTADRAKPCDTKMGKQIYSITVSLCYNMREILDLMKYYSSLYHVVRKLIAMKLYSKAMKITTLTFPSNLVRGLTPQHYDMYPKIAALWHQAATDIIESSPQGLANTEEKLILEFLENELKVFQVIAKERSTVILNRIFRLLAKLDTVTKSRSYRDAVNDFFDKIDVFLVRSEKYDVYYEALRFINLRTSATVNSASVNDAREIFLNGCELVEKITSRDEELNACFLIYKNMGIMLLKPCEDTGKMCHWNFEEIKKETLDVVCNFRNGRGILLNMKMICHVIQPLSDRWENCINNSDHGFLKSALLADILNLLKLMFYVSNSITTEKCETCAENTCGMKKYIFSVTVVSVRCSVIFSKIAADDLPKDLLKLIQELLEENVAAIFEMKECRCVEWSGLWNNCGINIYNLSVTRYKNFYEDTVFLFSLLCSCVVKFEGINAVNSILAIKNPLSYSLHKLSGVHFNHGNYREALTPCALNGLLSYKNSDTKAFHMWTSIKNASINSRSILKMNMLSCLREDMNIISEIGVDVNLGDYDLKELCLRELRGLHESRCNLSLAMYSVLDELEILDHNGTQYAQGVQLLCNHQLHHEYDENFARYFRRATKKLNDNKVQSDSHLLLAASFSFYTFVIDLREISDQTKAEMETAKFALRAVKSNLPEGQPNNKDNVVPAYTEINVTKDSKLFSQLKQALDKWSLCLKKNLLGVVSEWYLALTLRTLVIVGEYSRLHRFSTLETTAWELCYKLATQLNDTRTCVYAIGRSMSLRKIKSDWIDTGNNLTTLLESSNDPESNNTVASFWIGLSNFYFDVGKREEAADILRRVLALPNIGPLKNICYHLSTMDTILRNYHSCSNDNLSINYMVYVVKCLYSMIALMEYTPPAKTGKEKQLRSLEVLFASTSHLSLRMNSMLSFKEISSHLIHRLKLSQSSGITLQVAECLKNLCFIDLSRMQLDDCLVKLQGLDYILRTEYMNETRNTKNSQTFNNEIIKPGVRDSQIRDASPVLRKTVFQIPDFIAHSKCSCYKCSSVDYQYLVLSRTHIRAQLYFLQGHLNEALEHFSGAFFLRRKMLIMEMYRNAAALKFLAPNESEPRYTLTALRNTVEYVQLLLDFSRLIREIRDSNDRDGIDLAIQAVKVCEKFNLLGHTVYVAARELVLEYQFCRTLNEADFQKFTVPDPSSIDISKFTCAVSSIDSSAIATPASKPCVRKPKTIRRNKTPPLLKLTKISIDLSDDDDEAKTESPVSTRHRTKYGRINRACKSMRRKNLEKYLDVTPDSCSADNESDTGDEDTMRFKVSPRVIKDQRNFNEIINKAAAVFPTLAREFDEVLESKGIGESDKVKQVIAMVECAEPKKPKPRTYERKNKTKDSQCQDSSDVVSEIVNTLKELLINEKDAPKISVSEATSSEVYSSTNNFTSGSERKELCTPFSDKKTKKKLEFADCYESKSSNKFQGFSVTEEHEYTQDKERLRTSDRIRKFRSQSIELEEKEEPKASARTRIKSLQDGSKDVLITDSENSEMNDSGLIPSSDVEIQPKSEKRQTRTSARISRSKSQINPRTSSRLKTQESLNSASTSDPEDSSDCVKQKTSKPKRRMPKVSSRIKKSDNQLTQIFDSSENEADQKIPQLVVSEELELPTKKLTVKRTNSGRSKLKK